MRKLPINMWMIVFVLQAVAFSQTTETTLHNFTGGTDGAGPLGDLLYDSSTGLVYGTTNKGGGSTACTKGCGTVFSFAPGGTGYTTLYAFGGAGDGANPEAGLVADLSGNLYGTTYSGGADDLGTVFKLTPTGGGAFSESLLYSFPGKKAGSHPLSRLVVDGSGNLYGTTFAGGKGHGIVFELSPTGAESVLFTFSGSNGAGPRAGVVFDSGRNLWGTTSLGGTAKMGTVFELSAPTGTTWSEAFLYSFTGSNGRNPYAEVTLDSSGDVFGTTKFGGPGCSFTADGCGVVFELSPISGSYSESSVYSFTGASDGAEPLADVNLVLDMSGYQYLFGTASKAGDIGNPCPAAGCGVAFEICGVGSSCAGSSSWTEYTLFDFTGKIGGRTPSSGVLVFLPFPEPQVFRPLGHGACPSGCLIPLIDGGTSGNGTVDSLP